MTTVKISATIPKELNDQLETLCKELEISPDVKPKRSHIVAMLLRKGLLAYRQEKTTKGK